MRCIRLIWIGKTQLPFVQESCHIISRLRQKKYELPNMLQVQLSSGAGRKLKNC